MNCQECQELISVFLDDELEEKTSARVQEHLTACPPCAKLCEDFALILASCTESEPAEIVPPNSQALWCRINNIIENEARTKAAPEVEETPQGWFARGWRFTFSQLGVALACVAVISSLLTVVGLKNYFEPTGDDTLSRSSQTQTTVEKLLSKVGLADTPQQARLRRVKEQQAAVDYWTRRVAERRQQWDAKMRDAFDRNLYLIDESVGEYNRILEQNPDDDLSGEMLDAVMDEKVNLLRAFADL
jgi:hypothetical protein